MPTEIKRDFVYMDKLIRNVPHYIHDTFYHNEEDGNLSISGYDLMRVSFVIEYMNKQNIKEFDYEDFDKTEELVNVYNNWLSKSK